MHTHDFFHFETLLIKHKVYVGFSSLKGFVCTLSSLFLPKIVKNIGKKTIMMEISFVI